MYYYLYKITNLLNGLIYIGAHRSVKKNDEYYGSGKYIQRAIKKYGKENFKKEILEYYETEESMYFAERQIVNESFIKRKNTYNLKIGGAGGWPTKGSDEALNVGKKVKLWWDSLSDAERDQQNIKISITTEKAMENPIVRKIIKDSLANRPEEEKLKQYSNIQKGVKNYYDSRSEEEILEFKKQKKDSMSKPEVRRKISKGMRKENICGYENGYFKGNIKNKYEMVKDDIIKLTNTDMFDSDIYSYIKEKYGFGYKLNNLLKYYEYKNYIKNIETVKVNDLQTKNNILKNKTYCEDIR